ncbi:dephospho-CoA kinase [Rariglobus hedericola]|uniref:Dephospho-CoA kinase n=1 Tax=Rariglobus hedericola TaxID=2597822 RepID=A0A556QMU7_9BACT|nr:dephospho-CoA kinase [Rariglobus hedericola]TSJ77969.1 dephospho-CoA kinase [Rariglobus hedericola]
MILGITGGMGGGKSTAMRFFEEAGFRRIDSDRIVREDLLTDPAVVGLIKAKFPDVVNAQNEVQRAELARYVFGNDEDRVWLEKLLHPMVYNRWQELMAADPAADWAIETPLLFEQGLENWFDFTVCVSTSSANQLVRLIERGIPQSLAEQRISKQLPLAQKLEKADFILSNDGTPEALRLQVNHLAARLSGVR